MHLARLLSERANVDVIAQPRVHLRPDDARLYGHPIVFLIGHNSFTFSDVEVDALRTYLQRGGVVIADACCGRQEFDASVRVLARRLFPDQPLTPLPADHPIYTGATGVELNPVRVRPILAEQLGSDTLEHPLLEAITVDGREVFLYSPLDFSCALEGDNPYACRGYQDRSGQRIGVAIVLYALTH